MPVPSVPPDLAAHVAARIRAHEARERLTAEAIVREAQAEARTVAWLARRMCGRTFASESELAAFAQAEARTTLDGDEPTAQQQTRIARAVRGLWVLSGSADRANASRAVTHAA